jgi:hypothetical protein
METGMAAKRNKGAGKTAAATVPPAVAPPYEPVRSAARTALITGVVVGLVGIGTASAVYLWDTADSQLNQVSASRSTQVQADTQWIRARVVYGHLSHDALVRSIARTDKLAPYATRIGDYKQLASLELGNTLHRLSVAARAEVERDRGGLSAFQPSQIRIEPAQYQPQITELSDEIAMWEALDALIESVQRQGEKSAVAETAWDVWQKAYLKMMGDHSAVQKALPLELAGVLAESARMKSDNDQATQDFDTIFRRHNYALAGLCVSVVGLVLMGFLTFFGPKRT